jgi:hypothetical protein
MTTARSPFPLAPPAEDVVPAFGYYGARNARILAAAVGVAAAGELANRRENEARSWRVPPKRIALLSGSPQTCAHDGDGRRDRRGARQGRGVT